MSQPLVRSDDDGAYIVLKSFIYRPSTPFTEAAVGEKVSVTSKGLVTVLRYDDEHDRIIDKTEQWVAGESVADYKESKAEEKLWPEWNDFLGNSYKPGDYVVYASTWGSSTQLTFAQIVRINRFDSYGNQIEQYNYETRQREPGATLTVRALDTSKGSRWASKGITTVHDPAKVVRIDGSYMEKFAQLETELVDAEVERIKEKYA